MGYKRIVHYYPYPTGGDGLDNIIYEIDRSHKFGTPFAQAMKNFISATIQLGASIAGGKNDNKTAVKLEVEGIDFPIYLYKYDNSCYITKAIRSEAEGYPIHWNMEF